MYKKPIKEGECPGVRYVINIGSTTSRHSISKIII